MKTLNTNEISQINWHLTNNIFPPINEAIINKIIASLNKVRTKKQKLSDEILSSGVSIGEMVDDLKLNDYI
jgi:hypothetical protein